MTLSLDGDTLYAANASTFGTVNITTGAYTSIGSFGTASGYADPNNDGDYADQVLTSYSINDVDGLAIDATSGVFYGSERQGDQARPQG